VSLGEPQSALVIGQIAGENSYTVVTLAGLVREMKDLLLSAVNYSFLLSLVLPHSLSGLGVGGLLRQIFWAVSAR
jgi:hypothetical protein